jgi:hypothetical protein
MITKIHTDLLTFIGPNGEREYCYSALDLAKRYDLVPSAVRALVYGKRKSHKGWRLEQTLRNCSEPRYQLYHKDGTIATFDNAAEWAEDNGYKYGEVRKLLCGARKQLDGWTKEKQEMAVRTLIHGDSGEVVQITSVPDFCEQRGLLPSPVYEVLSKKRRSYKGWQLRSAYKESRWTVVSPTGEEHKLKKGQVRAFCREHGLDNSNFGKVLVGQLKTHRGWSVISRDIR